MSRSEDIRAHSRGSRKSVPNKISSPELLIPIEKEKKVLKRGEVEIGLSSDFRLPSEPDPLRFAVPFDPSLVAPGERPWREQSRENVRYRATHCPARLLSKAIRQAAARDPGLEWDETTRTYRLRRKGTPSPSPAKAQTNPPSVWV
jgi:hypothetical protein